MGKLFLRILLAVLALANTPVSQTSSLPQIGQPELALVGATLIDGTGQAPIRTAVVLVGGGRILAAGPASQIVVPPGIETRDLRGTTLLPGFVNAHAHSQALSADEMRAWTRAGITTIRDLGGVLPALAERRMLAASDPTLPRMLIAGPIVTVPGGHPIPVSGQGDDVVTVRGAADARATVNALLDGGANLIKIAVSGRTDVRWPELSNAEIAAITATARSRGARISAHIDRAVALRRAVENGISDAAHSPRDRVPDATFRLMAQRGVAFVPTIDVYENLAEERGNAAEWRRVTRPIMYSNLVRANAAGVLLAIGDDYGNPRVALGMPLDEMRHWQRAGLAPLQIIKAATLGSATVCGLEAEIGSVEAGKQADLLVVQGDPLADLSALTRPILVLHAGQVVRG